MAAWMSNLKLVSETLNTRGMKVMISRAESWHYSVTVMR